ncbi:MAG TPA: FAD-dependent oxidoreductase, partial [Burkholderiales bacterium]|nr:FAD-dependent oxidoreductase [Burkholderiales bacterium]
MAQRRRRDIWDVVVVGGGVAGLTAAWEASRHGLATALFEAEPLYGGQVANINVLDDWPATGEVSGVELANALAAKLRDEAVELINEPVRGVSDSNGLLRVAADKQTLRTKRVIVATGARLRTLGVPGEEALRGKGVSQCAYCDGSFFRNQDVVVVGGGDAALQEALVLAPTCRSVAIVIRSMLRAKRAYVDRASGAPNVRFVWDSVVERVLGNGAVTGVAVRNVKSGECSEVPCTGVFPFIGTEPNTGFLPRSVKREASGLAVTDERYRTSDPAVFAIGAARAGYSGALIHA